MFVMLAIERQLLHALFTNTKELDVKSDLIDHLNDEVELSKQQLRKQDGVLQKSEKDFSQRVSVT